MMFIDRMMFVLPGRKGDKVNYFIVQTSVKNQGA